MVNNMNNTKQTIKFRMSAEMIKAIGEDYIYNATTDGEKVTIAWFDKNINKVDYSKSSVQELEEKLASGQWIKVEG
jgi:hypothetical protein